MASPHLALTTTPLPIRREIVRKGLHLAAAALPIAYGTGAPRVALVTILAVVSALALLIEGARRVIPACEGLFEKAFGRLMRPPERGAVTGATWLALSCLVAVLVLSRGAAVAALWCATVGDPAATLAGRTWKIWRRTPSDSTAKTAAGALGGAIASFAGVWVLAGFSPGRAAVVAIASAVAESAPLAIDDNVRVAAAAGVIAQLFA